MFTNERFHVSASYLKKIELENPSSLRVPSDPKARAIASVCGVVPEDFLLERIPGRSSPAFFLLADRWGARPTYEFEVSECWVVDVPAAADRLRQRLPRDVDLINNGNDPKIRIIFQQLSEPRLGQHAECTISTLVCHGKINYFLVLDYYVDAWMPLCVSREVYGFPARLGHNKVWSMGAELTLNGLPLITLSSEHSRSETLLPDPFLPSLPAHLCHKQILAADGHRFCIDQLISFSPEVRCYKGQTMYQKACSTVRFHTSLYRMLWGVLECSVRATRLTNFAVTMPPGRVDRDYGGTEGG